ncbi:hypothetical protein MYX84_01385 [Acidobacteria bacterium AH-259-O06]|nr:hypothetical protein [Acidobacteria bacterium AH-259-O06]
MEETFPIVDAHVHFWDPDLLRFPWLEDILALNRPYLLQDFSGAASSLSVEKMVFVECNCIPSQNLQEVEWAAELAQQDPRIRGIVPMFHWKKGKQFMTNSQN